MIRRHLSSSLATLVALATGGCATGAHAAPPAAPAPPVKADTAVGGPRRVIVVGPDHERVRVARVSRGHLGVELLELTPELREHFGATKETGVMVSRVLPDGPAAKGGMKVGDVITAVDGQKVDDASDLRRQVREKGDKQVATVEVMRGRARQNLKVTVEHRPTSEIDLARVMQQHGPVVVDPERINQAVERAMRQQENRQRIEERLQERTRMLEQRLERLERELREKNKK